MSGALTPSDGFARRIATVIHDAVDPTGDMGDGVGVRCLSAAYRLLDLGLVTAPVEHLYRGGCPEPDLPAQRDGDCPACHLLAAPTGDV